MILRRRGEGVEPSGERNARQAGFEDRWGHRAPSSSTIRFYSPAPELKLRNSGNERTNAGLPNNVLAIYVSEKSTRVVGPSVMPSTLNFGGATIKRDLAILALRTWYTAAARASAR